jgi:ABC-2 type transport system ATP-binding protein
MATVIDPSSDIFTVDRSIVVETHELRKTYRTGFWLNQKIVSLKGCTLNVFRAKRLDYWDPTVRAKRLSEDTPGDCAPQWGTRALC